MNMGFYKKSKLRTVLSVKKKKYLELYHIYKRDVRNVINYGFSAPRYAERVWINPQSCKAFKAIYERHESGRVLENWPVDSVIPLTEIPKIRFCIEHWVNGVPWQDTGVYEYMQKLIAENKIDGLPSADGCKNLDDIISRYEDLDQIFEQVKREGRLKIRSEINPGNFRESGAVFVHIGHDSKPYISMGGNHRFAIAYILQLPKMPAQIGCVHKNAIPNLNDYRRKL